jgi:signal transduction histidine kinase
MRSTPASGSRARAGQNRQRVTKHHDDLISARDDATEESRQKSEFVATASHEIRTPMNGVIGLASLLLDTELDATQRSYAEGILESAEALLHVVNNTLDFSKLEAGKVELETTDFDLEHEIESVTVLVSMSAQAKELAMLTEIAPGVPIHLRGDVGRLRQVLLNLLGNAVKFTDAGTVTIRVACLVGDASDVGVMLHIEVQDTGVGISGDPARLFEPFAQASATTTRRYGGTGLGLAICARLVDAMGGTIKAKSHSGTGSIFQMEIPFQLDQTIAAA